MRTHTILDQFRRDMILAHLSMITITDRIELLTRLARWLLPTDITDATPEQLAAFQTKFIRLAPATIDVYIRHVIAFYRWALTREIIEDDPTNLLIRPKLHRGRPHPTSLEDMRLILAGTDGALRLAYVLAAFTGARRGEICRLQIPDLIFDDDAPRAHLLGKGQKPRTVPLIGPVVSEIHAYGLPRSGYLLRNPRTGAPYEPETLSIDSHRHLSAMGVPTTLHSMRHLFATHTYRTTHDLLMLAELLGHASVATTQIYAEPDMNNIHTRLASVTDIADRLISARPPARPDRNLA